MKNRFSLHPATCFLLLFLLTALLSWTGSIYEWEGVRSLLSDEGLRWLLRTLLDDYLLSPVFQAVVCLFFGVGLFVHSGLGNACRRMVGGARKFSRKEKRALGLAAVTFLAYAGLCVLLAFGPWNVVRSAIGTLADSPLADGLWGVCSLGIALPSIVYGFASDSYLSDRDVVEGMAHLYKCRATYFVVLLFITLFFSSLMFSGLTHYAGLPDEVCRGAYLLCCLFFLL